MAAAGNSFDEQAIAANDHRVKPAPKPHVASSKPSSKPSSRPSDLPRSDSTDPAFFNALYMQEQRAAFGGLPPPGAASATAAATAVAKHSASSAEQPRLTPWSQKRAITDLWDVPLSQDGLPPGRGAGQADDEVVLVAPPDGQSHPSIPSTASFSLGLAPICVVPSAISASQRDDYVELPPAPAAFQSTDPLPLPGHLPSTGPALPSAGPLPSTGPSDTSQITLDGPDALLMPLNQRTLAAHLQPGSSSYAPPTLPFSPPPPPLHAREYHMDTWTAAVRGLGAQTTVQRVQSEAVARARLAASVHDIPPTQEVLSTGDGQMDTQIHTQISAQINTQINTQVNTARDSGPRKRKQRDPSSSPDVILVSASPSHSHSDAATPWRPDPDPTSRPATTRLSPRPKRQRSTAAAADDDDDARDELASPQAHVGARVQVHLPVGPARNGDEWMWISDMAAVEAGELAVEQRQQRREEKTPQRAFGEQIADSEEDDDDDDGDYPVYMAPRLPAKETQKTTGKTLDGIPDTQSFSPPREAGNTEPGVGNGEAEAEAGNAEVETKNTEPVSVKKPGSARPAAKKQKARTKAAVLQKESTTEPKEPKETKSMPAPVTKKRQKQQTKAPQVIVIDDSDDDDDLLSSPGLTPVPDSESEGSEAEEAEEAEEEEEEEEEEAEPVRRALLKVPLRKEKSTKTQQRKTTSDHGQIVAGVQQERRASRGVSTPVSRGVSTGPTEPTKPESVPKKAIPAAAPAKASPSPGPSAAPKPAYRVGLSRRMRIAPLLKIVRKT